MALNLTSKKAVVSEVADIASQAHAVVAVEYHGLTVEQMTTLHARARQTGVYFRVVKNSLAKRALAGTEFKNVQNHLTGPLVLAFSMEDPGSAARLWRDFFEENSKLDKKAMVKFLGFSGQVMPGSELDRLAKMPTKDEAIALLMACMRAPLDKFARTLNEVPGKLVRTIEAIRQSKEAA